MHRSTRTFPRLGLVAALALGALAPVVLQSPAFADAAQLVEEANRKVRQEDVAAAIKLLEQAIAADPNFVDAHIRYQDIAKAAFGASALAQRYGDAAKAKPDDPVAQFLATRLLPPAQAVDAFDKLAIQFKNSPWPPAGQARALEDLGRFADAVPLNIEAVRRAGPDAPRFLAYRAYGYERAEQWALAVDAWTAAIAKSPKDIAARLGLAEALRRSQSFEESLLALDDAQKVGANEPEIAYRRGLVHVDEGEYAKAIEAFDAALVLDRGMIESLCGACDAAIKLGVRQADVEKRDVEEKDFEKALGYGDRASVSAPDSAYAHFVLGAAHEAAGLVNADQLDAALKEYDEALARLPIPGPPKVRTLVAKSFVLLQKGENDAAIDAAQKALDIDKTCVVAYGHAGHALAAQGKQMDAINKYYKPGLKVDPKNPRLLHDMGVAYWELKKPNDAKKPLEDARTNAPKNGRYRLTLGELYYELKRYKDAVSELFEATEQLPRDADAWRAYGRACYANKTWHECAMAYEKVCELDTETADEHLYLASVYADQLKDREKAREHVTKFREKGGSDPNLDDWMNQLLEDATTKKP